MSDSHFGAQARDVVLPGAGHANDGEEMSEERSGSLTWRRLWKRTEQKLGMVQNQFSDFAKLMAPSQSGWHVTLGRSDRLKRGPGIDYGLPPTSILWKLTWEDKLYL